MTAHGEQHGETCFRQTTVCFVCHGHGLVVDGPCRECHGSGRIEREQRVTVMILSGAEEGMALRIPGHGWPSPDPKGPPGDLYVIVSSAVDLRFARARGRSCSAPRHSL